MTCSASVHTYFVLTREFPAAQQSRRLGRMQAFFFPLYCNSSTRRMGNEGVRGEASSESPDGRHGSLFLRQLRVRVIGSNKAALENIVMDLKCKAFVGVTPRNIWSAYKEP